MPTSPRIKTKKTCCQDGPRCKRCPVVWKRLAKGGHAKRVSKVEYTMVSVVPKAALKSARAR